MALLALLVPAALALAPAPKAPQKLATPPAPTPPPTLACRHFKECSGCVVEAAFEETDMVLRARAVLEPLLGAPLAVVCGTPAGWRTQARLAAGAGGERDASRGRRGRKRNWRATGVELGLYRAGSHDVVGIPDCVAHASVLNDAAAAVAAACADAGVQSARGDDGELRYVQMSAERSSGLVALTLVWNRRGAKESAPQLPRLVAALEKSDARWHSIWVNYRGSKGGNAIFDYEPRTWAKLRGRPHLTEGLFDGASPDARARAAAAGADVDLALRFTPLVFRQANLAAFAALVASLAAFVPAGADLCELYGGVGAIGLALRPKCARVRCSEANPNAADGFARALADQDRRLPRLKRAVPVRFRALDAADAIRADAAGADVLVVDPPRKGLCPEVLDALLDPAPDGFAASVERLVYVSCGFDALQRELGLLLKSQLWTLAHAEAHVLFPGSDHVETLAVFDRAPAPKRR